MQSARVVLDHVVGEDRQLAIVGARPAGRAGSDRQCQQQQSPGDCRLRRALHNANHTNANSVSLSLALRP